MQGLPVNTFDFFKQKLKYFVFHRLRFKNEDRESGVESDEFAEIAAKTTMMTNTEYPYAKNNNLSNNYSSAGLTNLHQKTSLMSNLTRSNNLLKSSTHLTTGSSQLTKLTNELDRINDRTAYRGSFFNNITNASNNRISDKYVQRYKSIYSLDSPTRSPTHQAFNSQLKFDNERYNFLAARNDSCLVLKLKNSKDLTRHKF